MRFDILKDHPDYAVTRTGKMYSHKSGKWKLLKPQADTDGYLQVTLFKNGIRIMKFVHRIVAETYLPRVSGCTEVNHKDGNKTNNKLKNLEWCTRRENIIHAHDTGLMKTRKPIIVTDLLTGKTLRFKGQRDAARKLGINQGNLNHALKRNGSCYGFSVKYEEAK